MIRSKRELEYTKHWAEIARERCDKTKSFRHEPKNHMAMITGLLSRGDTQRGSVSISYTEDVFTLGVLLNISQH